MAKRSHLRTKKHNKPSLFVCGLVCFFFGIISLEVFFGYNITGTVHSYFQDEEIESFLVERGTFFDRNFNELAISVDRISVYGVTREIQAVSQTANVLASILGGEVGDFEEKLTTEQPRVWLAKNISSEEAKSLSQADLNGVFFHKEVARYYPQHETAAHLVGFSEGRTGLSGVEFFYDRLRDPGGPAGFLSKAELHDHAYVEGFKEGRRHLVLTIDIKIQKQLEGLIRHFRLDEKIVGMGGCVFDAGTGGVVGVTSYPFYNPNFFRSYDPTSFENVLLNRIIVPQKVNSFFQQALQYGADSQKRKPEIPWSIASGTKEEVIQTQILQSLGAEETGEVDFGIDLHHSADEKINRLLDTEEGVVPEVMSPLKIASLFGSLVNGGKKLNVHAVDRIVDENGESGLKMQALQEKSILKLSPEFKQLIRAQVGKDAAPAFYISDDSLQYIENENGREYIRNRLVLAAVPWENPELIFVMNIQEEAVGPLLAEMKGGEVQPLIGFAEPVFQKILARQRITKDLTEFATIEKSKTAPPKVANISNDKEMKKIKANVQFVMPDLRGMSLRKSLRQLGGKNLKLVVQGSGMVKKQSPLPGKLLRENSECRLELSGQKSGVWQ